MEWSANGINTRDGVEIFPHFPLFIASSSFLKVYDEDALISIVTITCVSLDICTAAAQSIPAIFHFSRRQAEGSTMWASHQSLRNVTIIDIVINGLVTRTHERRVNMLHSSGYPFSLVLFVALLVIQFLRSHLTYNLFDK